MSTVPDPPDPVVTEELALLDDVLRRLREVPWDLPPSEKEVVAELVRLREQMTAAKVEDKPAILQQYDQQFALLQQLRDSRERAQVDPDSPYFAHLRLREGDRQRDLFLGKATRIDHGMRIVDWRNAPISRVFYAYDEGDEYEEAFGERVLEGVVEARRTVTIERGRLERVDTPETTHLREGEAWTRHARQAVRLAGGEGASATRLHRIGQGGGRRLGQGGRHRADKRLPDIAGLIDPDQFALITRPSSGFLVVRGTAGSGKTTVALHRIAYLAYEDPSIDGDRTLFLVFSRALRDYVGRVLPSLGLDRVVPQTFPDWARTQVRKHFPRLPRAVRDDTPELVIRLKTHPATMIALERHRARVDGPPTGEQAVDDWVSVTTQLEVVATVFAEVAPSAFTVAQLQRATTWCRDRWAEIVARAEGDKDVDVALDAEDHALLLRAWQLRVGPLQGRRRRPLRYRHVAVDEVQDFSPVEVRVLIDCLDSRRSITLAGDTQQHVMVEAGFTSWTDFFRWIGVEGTAVDTLRVAYRSSRPIVSFAQDLLGEHVEDDGPPLTVRDGPPVEVFRFTDHGAVVAMLAEQLHRLARAEPLASIALVGADAATVGLYFDGLSRARVPRLRRVVDQVFAFAPGVDLVEVRDVKGLEFDYVVLLDVSTGAYPDTPSARRLLHVAATRAIHQLWVTSVGTPSPVLRDALAARDAEA